MAAYQYMFNSANIDTMTLTVVDNQPIDEYYLDRVSFVDKLINSSFIPILMNIACLI